MFYVRNLTKIPISFQGILIPAYASADVEIISDYIGLSALLNSGKATYGRKNKTVTEAAPEKKETVVVAVEQKEEAPVEPVSEPVAEAVEVAPVVEPKIEEKQIVEKTTKKRRNSAKDDN